MPSRVRVETLLDVRLAWWLWYSLWSTTCQRYPAKPSGGGSHKAAHRPPTRGSDSVRSGSPAGRRTHMNLFSTIRKVKLINLSLWVWFPPVVCSSCTSTCRCLFCSELISALAWSGRYLEGLARNEGKERCCSFRLPPRPGPAASAENLPLPEASAQLQGHVSRRLPGCPTAARQCHIKPDATITSLISSFPHTPACWSG